jgi:hypothetical protein
MGCVAHFSLPSFLEFDKRTLRLAFHRSAESARPGRRRIADRRHGPGAESGSAKGRALQAVTKEVVGIHVLPSRSLFGDGIPRRLPLRVSPEKPTSAALQF